MGFLEKLQDSDESVKKRWLVVLSAIAMLIIVFVWAKYFASITQPAGSIGRETSSDGFSFWETMRTGMSVLWEKFMSVVRALGGLLGASRNYEIKP